MCWPHCALGKCQVLVVVVAMNIEIEMSHLYGKFNSRGKTDENAYITMFLPKSTNNSRGKSVLKTTLSRQKTLSHH